VAALLPSGGKVIDYAAGLGGKASLSPSLPLLSVPTCPSGLELCREALLLVEGHALAGLRIHPSSLQSALVDPTLTQTLRGEAALGTAWAVLVHAAEAYLRPDPGIGGRDMSWLALELSARAFLPFLYQGGKKPLPVTTNSIMEDSASAATYLAAASALVSASLAQGPLGPCRGLALSIAARYSIPYSTALLAVTPRLFSAPAEVALGAYEEMALELEEKASAEEANEVGGVASEDWRWDAKEGGSGEGRGKSLGEGGLRRKKGLLPRTRGVFPQPSRKGVRESSEGVGGDERMREESAREDEEIMRLAALAGKEMAGAMGEEEDEESERKPLIHTKGYKASQEMPLSLEEEDSELIQVARRYSHVATLLTGVLPSPSSPAPRVPTDAEPGRATSQLEPWDSLGAVVAKVRLDSVGRSAASNLFSTLASLSTAGAMGVGIAAPPCLEDYGLTDADLEAVSEMAEVDENTLNSVVSLKRSDILKIMKDM